LIFKTYHSQISGLSKQPCKPSGFTLIEILIAISIFAIVVTTIFGSYRSVFSDVETMGKGTEINEMARNCLERMALDLQSLHIAAPPLYTPPGLNDSPAPYRIVGESFLDNDFRFDRLRFTALAHIQLEKSKRDGIAEIYYYVQKKDNGDSFLRRSDKLYPYESFKESSRDPILCEYVKSLAFYYFDREGAEYDRWDSDSDDFKYATPRAIGIKLELENAKQSLMVETIVTLPTYRKNIS
jgi:general secretion pathway protein J